MTDLEISKALALAVGWKESDFLITHSNKPVEHSGLQIYKPTLTRFDGMQKVFDYRDWNVIGPIAERYGCFPYQNFEENWVSGSPHFPQDTPQKAIALAVIGANK